MNVSKSLKNKKASFSDLIKNEMIKASCGFLLNAKKLFILYYNQDVPKQLVRGAHSTYFLKKKSGDNTDPGNYTGICVSSCLGKFFSSIINQRLLKFLEEKKLLHPSQIGFLKDNRTADHIFTLRTLIEKYSHHHNQNVYACFVDFKKAFDSVWHEDLFFIAF